jgi:L-ascorbate metabolism protein UlaG (beta-lactamase superfamily)
MAQLTYLGHATVLVEMDGVRLLTDPTLRDRVLHLYRQSSQIDPRDYQDIDAVLISHLHWDHLDFGSLRKLDPSVRLIVPPGAADMISRKGYPLVEELSVGEGTTIGSLTVQATPALHSGFRPPFGPQAECLGYIISGHRKIYFAGDTDIFPQMSNLAENLDVALLPIWGWGPNLGSGHMDPHRAAQALQLLNPKVAIPIHWGTFVPLGISLINRGFLSETPEAFSYYTQQMAPSIRIEIIPPGISISLEDIRNLGNKTK